MISISIDKPTIPVNAGFKHQSTSWQISKDKEFSEEGLIIESLEDPINLVKYEAFEKTEEDEVVFARVRIHFDNDMSTEWSRAITLSEEQKGFKLSNTLVVTPKIFIDDSIHDVSNGFIEIRTSDFALFAGVGRHTYTSWYLESADGTIIWSRLKDEDNLTSIKLPMTNLKEKKFYTIKVRHGTDTNTESNYGRQTISTGTYNVPVLQ